MVSRTEAGASWASIAACALIAALVPAGRTSLATASSIGLLALVWAGAVSCSALTYSASSRTTISLLPCIMAYMALRRPPWTVEAAFVAGCIVGYSVMEIRQRRSTAPSLASVLEHSLQAWASLRLVTAARSLMPASRYDSYWMVLLLMVAGVAAAVLLQRHLRILFRPPRGASLWVMLRQTGEMVGVPALFTPLLVPGRIDSVEAGGLTAAGFTALVIAQIALYLALDRSRHSVGRSRAASRALSLLTEGLSRASTPLDALRGLSSALRHSPGYRWLRLDWGAISLVSPPHKSGDAGAPLVFGAGTGLVARVVPPREGLDSRRLRSFLSHTRTALQNLELRRSAGMEAWTTMETMVYSLDRADRRLAGHSKEVAEVALELGRSLKLSSAMLDNLRMAALLHHIAPTVLQEQRGGMGGFTLPRPTVETLAHMSENVDGSGRPDGLKGNTIPLLARILRVADDYVTERERSGPEEALAGLRRRADTIYDGSLVSLVALMTGLEEA
ncbi:MAG: HD-GYP domain-containing protein [Candidatus Fermentibacterota bacterium]